MIRISLPYIYNLSETLEPLANIQFDAKYSDIFLILWKAQNAVETLIQQSVFAYSLRSSRSLAESLVAILKEQSEDSDFDRVVEPHVIAAIQHTFNQFKVAFLAEMGVLPSYFVTQKEPFDTVILLERGTGLFPPELVIKAPESQFDAVEAGKALAFELGTACGFHLFRVVESVLRRYYAHVSSGTPAPKVRSITIYVKKMRQMNVGHEIVLTTLEQLAMLHRNPLIHPEVALSLDETISLLGIARSAVTAMLAELPVPPLTTSSASIPQA
jgi:hypothetical protein